MKPLPLLLAAIAAVSVSAPSLAAAEPSRTVGFDRSELRSDEGREALEHRLENAARQVCAQPGLRGVERHMTEARCREDALERAMASVYADSPATTQTARRENIRITVASSRN